MRSCDLFAKDPHSSTKQLYMTKSMAQQVDEGARVYVPTSALPEFAKLLP
jgi:hypothetical protein